MASIYSQADRQRISKRIITLLRNGDSLEEACKYINISPSTIYSWVSRKMPEGLEIDIARKEIRSSISVYSEAVLLLSDLHIGRSTSSFNDKIYIKRLEYLFSKIKDILLKYHNIKTLHIFDMGDNIHGEKVGYQGQFNDYQFGVPEQIAIATDTHRNLITKFLEIFDDIIYSDTPGNHGKLDKLNSEGANWDLIRVNYLEKEFNNNRVLFNRPKNINFTVYNIVEVGKYRFLITHGDSIRSFGGFPYSAIIKKMLFWRSFENFDGMCLGHFHSANKLDVNGIPILMNSTLVSDDNYATRLGYKSLPSQTFFIMSPMNIIDGYYEIRLT